MAGERGRRSANQFVNGPSPERAASREGRPARATPSWVRVALCAPCKSGARGQMTVDSTVHDALESGRTYVNVHTRKNPAGEIRGQLKAAALTIS